MAQKRVAGRPPLGQPAWGCRPLFAAFLLYAPDCLMKSVSVALDRSEVVGGRVSWPRPASLGLSLLGPPIHQCVDQWLHILLIDGFGLGVELEYCMWTHLIMAQAFRSWFVYFV